MACLVLPIMLLPFLLPAILGRRLLKVAEEYSRATPLAALAGWLTLEPLITAPLWLIIIGNATHNQTWQPAHFLSILPGAGLSLLALFLAWPHFTGEDARFAWLLLGLDCLRWANSFVLGAPMVWRDHTGMPSIETLGLIGILAPTFYAVTADQLIRWQSEQAEQQEKELTN